MAGPTLFVISDLHLGADTLDDFEAPIEAELVRFLEFAASSAAVVELVINGDLLDFVQAPPFDGEELESETEDGTPLCFTQAQSISKLDAIAEQHASTFDALGRFVATSANHRITILPGNHDADFFWPAVRARFLDRVCRSHAASRAQIAFHLERSYRPEMFRELWIEHGHQHDLLNRFVVGTNERWSAAHPPILTDCHGQDRLLECIGTRFLIRYLNELDESYPFVDNVKPFSRFLRLFFFSALTRGFGPLRAGWALIRIVDFLNQTMRTRGGTEVLDLNLPAKVMSVAELIRDRYTKASEQEQEAFLSALAASGFIVDRDPAMLLNHPLDSEELLKFIDSHAGVLNALDPPPTRDTLDLIQGFRISETAELRNAARTIVAAGAGTVIMGHTHEIIDNAHEGYLNTGCWIRYMEFEPDNVSPSWSSLRREEYKRFPFRLMYAKREGSSRTVLTQFT